jgi:hydroxymethylbilane synthase
VTTRVLILGTRGSRLALWQAHHVRDRLGELAPEVRIEVRTIKTEGDRVQDRPLAAMGTTGVFVKELESAMRKREIDFAVHSLKDLPTAQPEDLAIAAVTVREEPYDMLVSASGLTLATLPKNAVVGTSSPRRASQIKFHRPDVELRDLRGNIDTRVRKMLAGDYAAILLAEAGLRRLGLEGIRPVRLEPEEMLPCGGQGALGIECRADDRDCAAVLAKLEHAATRHEVDAERAVLRLLGGGCSAPVGALGREGEPGRSEDVAKRVVEQLERAGAREMLPRSRP